MENDAVDVRLICITGSLHSVLEDGAADTFEGISNDRGGNEMIWMDDEKIVHVVDRDLPCRSETTANDMYIGAWSAMGVKPGLAKRDGFGALLRLVFYDQDLCASAQFNIGQTRGLLRYLFGH